MNRDWLLERMRRWGDREDFRPPAAVDQLRQCRRPEPVAVIPSRPATELTAGDDADGAVQTVARTLSHELNQPLTVLLGLLDLWERGYFADERAPLLRVELAETVRELTARIQAFTRMERFAVCDFAGDRLIDLRRAQVRPCLDDAPEHA